MYRTRDFILMDAISVNGKKLGFVSDLIINFNEKKVIGFNITPKGLFKRNLNVFMKDVLSFTKVMVITKTNRDKFLQFNHIKGMDVIDKKGSILGMVEDILFDKEKFFIKALVLSTGLINNFINGKKILLINDLVLGDENLLYRGKNENLIFSNLPNKLFMEDDIDENSKQETI